MGARRMAARARPKASTPVARPPAWRVWGTVALGILLAALAAVWLGKAPKPALPPNVLLITVDTLRADRLGCYGHAAAATPNLDALAARGVRFATAVAHVPLTTPSHASILTGLTPLRHGVRDNGDFVLPDGIPTLAEAFAGSGYHTAAFVSGFPLDRRFGLARGFQTYDDRLPRGSDLRRAAYVERAASETTAAAMRWLDRAQAPWFLWLHYFDPHSPYEPPAEFAQRFARDPYDGEVAFVDSELGALLRRPDFARERTIVLVTADHGESLGEHGEETHGVFVYDATLRVPWIMAGPSLPEGRVSPVVARGVDVAPTLLDLAGVRASGMEGRSLGGAARGQAVSDEPAYAESLYARLRLGWAPLHAWRTSRFKLIRAPRPELYALDSDPAETRDRTGETPDVARSLERQLEAALATPTPKAAAETGAESAERLRALGYVGGGEPGLKLSLRDPKDGIGLINRLEQGIARARADPRAAVRDLTAVLTQDPGLLLARRYRALAFSAAGDHRGAMREVQELDRDGAAVFDDLLLLAESLRLLGRPIEAQAALDRSERLQPRSPEPPLVRARMLLAAGRRAEAASQFERVLALAPGHAEALRGLGDLALARGDLAAAAGHYEQILSADPGDVAAMVKLGVLRVRAGRMEEAIALLQSAVRREPGNAEALLDLGGVLAKSGRPAEAVPYLEKALGAGAKTTVAWNSLGFARLESGDLAGALVALRASLVLHPKQPQIAEAVAEIERRRRP